MTTEKDRDDLEYTLVPAYGRDYKTGEEALAAWKAGRDFRIETALSRWAGKLTSIRDMGDFPGQHVRIRYNRKEKILLINLKTGNDNDNGDDQDILGEII